MTFISLEAEISECARHWIPGIWPVTKIFLLLRMTTTKKHFLVSRKTQNQHLSVDVTENRNFVEFRSTNFCSREVTMPGLVRVLPDFCQQFTGITIWMLWSNWILELDFLTLTSTMGNFLHVRLYFSLWHLWGGGLKLLKIVLHNKWTAPLDRLRLSTLLWDKNDRWQTRMVN